MRRASVQIALSEGFVFLGRKSLFPSLPKKDERVGVGGEEFKSASALQAKCRLPFSFLSSFFFSSPPALYPMKGGEFGR